jgi:hypothetical protein
MSLRAEGDAISTLQIGDCFVADAPAHKLQSPRDPVGAHYTVSSEWGDVEAGLVPARWPVREFLAFGMPAAGMGFSQ